MKKYFADKHCIIYLRVLSFILILFLIGILNYGLDYIKEKFPQYFLSAEISVPEIVVWAVIIVFIIAYVLFLVIILPLWLATLSYIIYTDEIEVRYGLWSKNRKYMKLSAIQYTTKVSFPLSKFTCLNFVFLHALGGRLSLMFLNDRDAEKIVKKIDNYILSRGGL